MSIAENIKMLRDRYGLTQADLGEIAGVSDKAVSTWENGTAEPRMGAVQKIAEHFGITKGSIVDDSPASSSVDRSGSAPSLSADEQLLLSLFRQLNEEGQEMAIEHVSYLVSTGRYKKNNQHELVEKAQR